jgi:3'-5' exonuclease
MPTLSEDVHYLVFDIETIPDGDLLRAVKYPGESLSVDAAVDKARTEALAASDGAKDFIASSFHVPIALCVAKVNQHFQLRNITCLDDPQFRPREIVRIFWERITHYTRNGARLVTFNGRRFDIPLLELCAFRWGFDASDHFSHRRDRYKSPDIDLYEVLGNRGTNVIEGGLDLLAKMIGMPGKLGFRGDQVLDAWRAGRVREINDYCLGDVLDTYFVFLRLMRIQGRIDADREAELISLARSYIESKRDAYPALAHYLAAMQAPVSPAIENS